MRALSYILSLIFILGLPVHAISQKPIAGSSAVPSQISFTVNKEYCDLRSPYAQPDSSMVPSGGYQSPVSKINDLASFSDNGAAILLSDQANKPSGTQLMSDGSDSARLLFRAFSAGPCTQQIDPKRVWIPVSATVNLTSSIGSATWATPAAGTITTMARTPAAVYTAPNAVPVTSNITVSVTGSAGQSASATVTIINGGLVLAANSDSVSTDGSLKFSAFGTDGSQPSVQWAVNPAMGAGTIDQNGLYKAPTTAPTKPVTITATTTSGAVRAASAQITITPRYRITDAAYYVINVVRWNKKGTAYQVGANDWFLFNTSDGSVIHQVMFSGFQSFHPNLSADNRIFGRKDVGFLAVHLRSEDISQAEFERNLKIAYNVSIQKVQAVNVQDLLALIGFVIGTAPAAAPGGLPSQSMFPVGLYGGGLLTDNIDSLPASLTFEADINFPTPMPAAAAGAPATSTGGTSKPPSSLTCDETADSKGQQPSCSFTKAYTDEGLYHWDVSVGVPVTALNQLSYSSTDGTVSSKTNQTINAYGFLDLYPKATDLTAPPAFAYPHLIVGLPFSGKVFNKPFVGGGMFNLKQLPWIGQFIPVQANVYGGWVVDKLFKPAMLTTGSPATMGALSQDLKSYRSWQPQYGIEFSIRGIKNSLVGSKTSSTKAGMTTTKSGS